MSKYIDYLRALIGMSKAAIKAPYKITTVGRHYTGRVGQGHAHRSNHSQRSRSNRRSAKRAARVRSRGA